MFANCQRTDCEQRFQGPTSESPNPESWTPRERNGGFHIVSSFFLTIKIHSDNMRVLKITPSRSVRPVASVTSPALPTSKSAQLDRLWRASKQDRRDFGLTYKVLHYIRGSVIAGAHDKKSKRESSGEKEDPASSESTAYEKRKQESEEAGIDKDKIRCKALRLSSGEKQSLLLFL